MDFDRRDNDTPAFIRVMHTTMHRLFRAMAIVVLVGCDESVPEPAPVANVEAPAPPAETETEPARVERAEPSALESSYVEKRTDLPSMLTCPGPEICVTAFDAVVWVLKRGWEHHYRLDYGSPNAAVRAGGGQRSEWFARIEAGVVYVLAEEHAASALGHCSLAALMPELYQVDDNTLAVDVPQTEPMPPRPMPISPIVANAHLRSEYAFINLVRAESMVWFTETEIERMTGITFDEPHVRHVSGWRTVDGNHRSLDLLVAYSPESENVYVLERTREVPEDEYRAQRDEQDRLDEEAQVDFIRSLHVRGVSYDAAAACEIPAAFGGREWMPIHTSPH